jgi:hypothetical protein
VWTARFAGEHASDGENLAKLHREAPAGSRARYVCVIAHVTPEGEEQLFEGRCRGTLAAEPHGAGGFGYDPIFVADETPSHDGGAHGQPRRTRSPTAVTPPGSCSHGWARGNRRRHDPGSRSTPAPRSRAAAVSIVSNTILIALKVVAASSPARWAILTEALHSSIDLLASLIAFFSVRRAEEPADASHRYGTREVRERGGRGGGDVDPRGSAVIAFAASAR